MQAGLSAWVPLPVWSWGTLILAHSSPNEPLWLDSHLETPGWHRDVPNFYPAAPGKRVLGKIVGPC